MSSPSPRLLTALTASLLALIFATPTASAFCGFYVSVASDKLSNNATMVVMMREGQRTVLSMQNTYQGPAEDFAMVVPVPVVLKEENVKTLDPAVFDKVDKMASPRLVEYWEQDPCAHPKDDFDDTPKASPSPGRAAEKKDSDKGGGVKIEAQFKVAEYDIVILSATDSSSLDRWMATNKYSVPKGAKEAYQPYIDAGMYFFVAKVDVKKVKYDAQTQRALLSPLRFHYDDKAFSLPIRLGLINADGAQDLIVHILAPNQRYEVANYRNVTIPTNIDVVPEVKERFGEFYAALFDKTLEKHPAAAVTEYAWAASTCDPCPGPNLGYHEFLTLGADVLPSSGGAAFVLTRLHLRYTSAQATQDLIFREAEPIVGGREFLNDKGVLERGAVKSSFNNFQGRYAIRHLWEGKLECQSPVRGRWGGPPAGTPSSRPIPAQNTAFVKRGAFKLKDSLRRNIPELGLDAPITTLMQLQNAGEAEGTARPRTIVMEAHADEVPEPTEQKPGCATSPQQPAPVFSLALLMAALLLRRARRTT